MERKQFFQIFFAAATFALNACREPDGVPQSACDTDAF